MSTIRLPAPLAELAGRSEISVEAATVLEAIKSLDMLRAGLFDRICTEQNEPRKHVLIYVGDTDIRELNGTRTELKGDEIIYVVPSLTGG
jgi:molybdopterin synthase sulfur carrier subunit